MTSLLFVTSYAEKSNYAKTPTYFLIHSNNETWSAVVVLNDIICDVIVHIEEVMTKKRIPLARGHRRFVIHSNNESWSAVSAHEANLICDVVALILKKL